MYVSVIVPMSRVGSEDLIIDNLKRNLNTEQIWELIVVVDNEEIDHFALKLKLEDVVREYGLRSMQIIRTGRKAPRKLDMAMRRNRIADNHNRAKEWLGASHFVIGFEDDTILPDGAFQRLIGDYVALVGNHNVGFIEGVEVGRWGKPYVGAWTIDDLNAPTEFNSLLPPKGKTATRTVESIDAGGFYCFLTPTELYKDHNFIWHEPLGPDIHYGIELGKKGYSCFIDWGLHCGHKNGNDILELDDSVVVTQVKFSGGKWRYASKKGSRR